MKVLNGITPLDGEDKAPLYVQIQKSLRRAVQNQVLASGDALPPERDLAEGFGVSRITIRKAVEGLVEEGLLDRRQGSGTYVAITTDRIEKNFSRITSFSEDMAARGFTVRSEWISRSTGAVTPEESLMLGLSPGTAVYRFNRIRFANDLALAIEYSTIETSAVPSLEAVGTSLYAAMAQLGNRPVRALQRLRAIGFDEQRAALLGLSAGAPGLLIERRGLLRDGRPIEFTTSYYRGDSYDFLAEMSE